MWMLSTMDVNPFPVACTVHPHTQRHENGGGGKERQDERERERERAESIGGAKENKGDERTKMRREKKRWRIFSRSGFKQGGIQSHFSVIPSCIGVGT